ncbi:hypothetical protein C2S52_012634 [Perilla frutescens var. hirtella]|uniref:Ionotropic receptor n=1 Tax=Perilla frutescens var. hirtella TaxID=608512 RepID=A0AAD4ILT6_PERFH|nr:hypothetical protein C2S53_019053 [Perilla frutescens var. hirtella]KAH6775073.1 hypothetical protein C2S52_012634 [Perilla frutescens var. hirtella]
MAVCGAKFGIKLQRELDIYVDNTTPSVYRYAEEGRIYSRNGGVSAIVDEIPYIRLFLSKYCHKYTAFRNGSPLVSDVSTTILNMKDGEKMDRITRTWLGAEGCSAGGLESLNLDNLTGLFFIAGLSSSTTLAIFLSTFLYENRHILASTASIKQKLHGLA